MAWARLPFESASRIAGTARRRADSIARRRTLLRRRALSTPAAPASRPNRLKALLDSLGFESTFALCDMEHTSVANPHCALITTIDGVRYIADAGWPLPAAIALADEPTTADVPVYRYHVDPMPDGRWRVWRESGTFVQDCFYLKPMRSRPTFPAVCARPSGGRTVLDNSYPRLVDGRSALRPDQGPDLACARRETVSRDVRGVDVPGAAPAVRFDAGISGGLAE